MAQCLITRKGDGYLHKVIKETDYKVSNGVATIPTSYVDDLPAGTKFLMVLKIKDTNGIERELHCYGYFSESGYFYRFCVTLESSTGSTSIKDGYFHFDGRGSTWEDYFNTGSFKKGFVLSYE